MDETLNQPLLALQRYRRIVTLALPIIGGMMSQNILNLVDTWMVGQKGAAALAAVGTGGMVNFMSVALVMGLSAGVQAVAARRHGEGKVAESAEPLNGALALAMVVGIPLTLLIAPLIPTLFAALNPDPSVVAIGVPYLTARVLALTFAGINFSFRGYWNGTNRSQLYMFTLLIVHATNIILNYVLIFGKWGFPEYGAVGAGIASGLATGVGALSYLWLGFRHARGNGFLSKMPDRRTFSTIIQLAAPTCLQQLLFAGGLTTLFAIMGRLGTLETGAASVLINVMLVAILPGLALGITATSLVGQALGRSAPRDAARWGWDVVKVSLLVSVILAIPMLFATDAVLSPFLSEAGAVDVARWPLRVFALAIVIDSAGTVLQQALLGAGANRNVMLVSVLCQWGLFLPLAYLVGPLWGFGLLGIWCVQAGYRGFQAAIYGIMWYRGRWSAIEL